jgi:tRNA(fMet)-specific endonuclease VapC
MFILDTDHFTMLEWGNATIGQQLHERIRALPEDEVVTTIITFEEQTRGWLAFQARSRKIAEQVKAYRRLKRHLDAYLEIEVLEFDTAAATLFQTLQNMHLKVGTMDLKIAAIALAHDGTVLTRNSKDFGRVPGLRVEDWTA